MQDLLLDETFAPVIENGDFAIGDSTYQHQMLLLTCNKGEFKQFPMRCVGASRYIESHNSEGLAREISTEFALDGMKVKRVKVNIPDVQIDAYYE